MAIMIRLHGIVFVAVALLAVVTASAGDLVVDGTTVVVDTDTRVEGGVVVENGGTLTVRNATLTLVLAFDEEHHVEVTGPSQLVVEDGVIQSEGGQFWFELSADDNGDSPTMRVSGDESWLTNHSGIRPFDDTHVVVTGGDVEELQVRDRVQVELSTAGTYPVFFFDGITATLSGLHTGESVTNTVSVPGGWSMSLTEAFVEGYQIDLQNGANLTLDDSDGIVMSLHTPGNLGPDLKVVEGLTSDHPTSGALTNLGTELHFTNTQIDLVNVYTLGADRVLLRGVHVNEVNAEGTSELVIGQEGFQTPLCCNLCQVYDHATFTVDHATIDASLNVPSATASYHDFEEVGYGVMKFVNVDLRETDLTVREFGTMILVGCQYDPARLEILDPTATFTVTDLLADFSAAPRSGPAPLQVAFTNLTTGDATGYEWSFGDGGTSTAVNPTHIYQSEGSYSVSLRADGAAASDTMTKPAYIEVTPGTTVSCDGAAVLVPAAAHSGGAAGSVWRTELAVFNPGSASVELGLRFLPSDQDNAGAVCVAGPTVAAGASVLLEDVVLATFGLQSAVGGIALYAGDAPLVVSSRTYNQAPSGTFGQAIPGRTVSEALAPGSVGHLVELHENAAFRTNLGFLNTSASSSAVVTVDYYDQEGTHLGQRQISLDPLEQHQENRAFTAVTTQAVTNGRARLQVTGAPVLAYASVVDNQTSDPSYLEPW